MFEGRGSIQKLIKFEKSMETKKWYESKTLLVNGAAVFMTLYPIVDALSKGESVDQALIVSCVLAAINVVLRLTTTQAIR